MGHSWDADVYIIVTNFLTGSCFGLTCGAGHTANLYVCVGFLTHFHYTQMCLCLFVLCHPAAPDEGENVVQSDESENGILLSPLI